jgi:hypothetical protein
MKYLLVFILLTLVSCSKEDKTAKADSNVPNVDAEVIIPVADVDVKVAWERYFPPGRKVLDYTDVNQALASKIVHALKQEGEPIKDLPQLRKTTLKVDSKEYRLYPHTILDLENMKSYKLENVFKDLYKDWMKYIITVENQ